MSGDCTTPCPVMGLKEMRLHDVESNRVFFSDFAQMHEIDGRRMDAVIFRFDAEGFSDGVSGRTMSRSPNDVGRAISRTYTREVQMMVRASDFGPRPAVGSRVLVDGAYEWKLTGISDEGGVYVLIGKENDL